MSECLFNMVADESGSVLERSKWYRNYKGYDFILTNTVYYKWMSIEVAMTEAERAMLERETYITMDDINMYQWELIDAYPRVSDWEIYSKDAPDILQTELYNQLDNDCFTVIEEYEWKEYDDDTTGFHTVYGGFQFED